MEDYVESESGGESLLLVASTGAVIWYLPVSISCRYEAGTGVCSQ